MNGLILPNGALVLAGMLSMGVLAGQPGAAQAGGPRPLDASSPITYFIADGTAASGFRPSDRQLAVWALEAWERSAGRPLRFQPAVEADAVVRVYWVEADDGLYGEMRPLTVDGRPGAAVYIRPDVEALGDAVARRARSDALFRDTIVYLTCLHELGHAIGLSHTSDFEDIMYFFGYGGNILEYFGRYRAQLRFRSDIAAVTGVSDADVSRVRALYRQ